MSSTEIIIHCDGSHDKTTAVGGFGAVVQHGRKTVELAGATECATSARAELLAAVTALRTLKGRVLRVKVFSDSQYLVHGITSNISKWMQSDWRNASKMHVSNKDLWLELFGFSKRYSITWNWIKGHEGHELNEKADTLAKQALALYLLER